VWPMLPEVVKAGILAMVEAAEPGTGSQRCRQRRDEGPQRAQASPQRTPLPQSIIPSRSLRPSGVFGALRAPQGQGAALFFTCFLGRSARPSNKAEKGTREQSRARPRCEVFAIRGLLGRVRGQPLPYKVSPYRVEVLGAYIITRGQWRMRDTLALLPSVRGIRSFSCFSPSLRSDAALGPARLWSLASPPDRIPQNSTP